jgi:hypothetical protein
MNTNTLINIISIILIICVILLLLPIKNSNIRESFNNKLLIPPVVIQIVENKNMLSNLVKKNIESFAYGYQHLIFDYKDCQNFLKQNFDAIVVNKFNSLKRIPMKNELFKYCYLYKKGGIYLNTKSKLLRPINSFINNNYIYTILAKDNTSIHTDLLASPPNRSLFIEIINYILYTEDLCQIMTFRNHFYNLISQQIGQYPLVGLNRINEFNFVYLFKENCTLQQNKYDNRCLGGFDTNGFCCFINDFNQSIIRSEG